MENKWTLHPNGLETIEKDQLFKALSKAQAEFPTIQVNRKAFKNEYADLYALLKPVYPILSKYGLNITPWGATIDGVEHVGAMLGHESGQYRTNYFKLYIDPCKNPNDQPSHKKQSTLTYFNRNHMKDMLGLLIGEDPDDDDGQGQYTQQVHHRTETITKEMQDHIRSILDNDEDMFESLMKYYGLTKYDNLSMLPKSDYEKIIDTLQKKKMRFQKQKPENIISI